ncbi:MAG: DegV family protein [Anaerolineae bacterium]|nr:DegV family protein [Anaerolineae bacterium]
MSASSHTIALMCDSTCDIPEELVAQYDITVLPAYVIWGEEQFLDRVTLQADAFYRRLVIDPVYPSSSHPTPGDFRDAYQAARASGASGIVVVTVSSAMSGTYNAARQAADTFELPVRVVDSKGPTMSLGWQVLAAARAREDLEISRSDHNAVDETLHAMVHAAGAARAHMAQLVYMDAIKYLHKGGRIGNAVSLLGTALRIRPVIYIDHETGLVEVERAARTRKRGIEALVQGFYDRLDLSRPLHVAVLHGGVPDEGRALAERVRNEINPAELLVNTTGPVLGINTGPGALALCGYYE